MEVVRASSVSCDAILHGVKLLNLAPGDIDDHAREQIQPRRDGIDEDVFGVCRMN
jgi:hypothetical protein